MTLNDGDNLCVVSYTNGPSGWHPTQATAMWWWCIENPYPPPPPQLLSSLTARLSDITTLSVITSLRDFLYSIFSDISLDGLLKCNVNHPVSLLNNLQHFIWDAASSYPSLRSSFVCCITLLTELETSPVIPVDGLYLIYHRWRSLIQTQVMLLQL